MINIRDFPRPDLGPNSAPSQFKIEKKLPTMVYIIHNFLVQQIGENFTKTRTKIAKLEMHKNLHKNMNENLFSFTFYANIPEFL